MANDQTPEAFEQWLNGLIDEKIAANKSGAPEIQQQQTAPVAQPLKLSIGGKDYEFKTPEELNTTINGVLDNYNRELEKVQSQVPRTPPPVADGPRRMDKNKFAETFVESPEDAVEMALQAKFGFDNPIETIKATMGMVESQRRQLEIYNFRDQNPDFPHRDKEISNMIGGIVQNLNLPATAEGLTAAWAYAKERKMVTPIEQPKQAPQGNYGGFGGDSPYLAAPPQIGRQTAEDSANLSKLQGLSLDQLEDLVKRASGQ